MWTAIGITAAVIASLLVTLGFMATTALRIWLYSAIYAVVIGLFKLCDFFQTCFRRLAGLDTYYYKDDTAESGKETSNDILIKLFSSKTVVEALIAMTLFAVALLLIVTIIQIIRVEYTTEGSKNSKGTILGKAIKSFAMFILVPVVCFLGIFVSNKLLLALDSATAQTGSKTLSSKIFLAGTADANVVRMGGSQEGWVNWGELEIGYGFERKAESGDNYKTLLGLNTAYFSSNKTTEEARRYELSVKVDELFTRNYSSWTASKASNAVTFDDIKITGSAAGSHLLSMRGSRVVHYTNSFTIQYFYDFTQMSYIVLFFGTSMVLMSLIKASFGLMIRLYKGVALFIISPAVTALTPLDDGNAYKSWRKSFISSVLSAYGYIVALNLLFLVMGVIDNIYLFPDNLGYYTANKLVHMMFAISGMHLLSDFSALLSGFIGGEDALKSGEGLYKKVSDTGKKIGKLAAQTTIATVGMFSGIGGGIAAKNVKRATSTIAKSANTIKEKTAERDKYDKGSENWLKENEKLMQDRDYLKAVEKQKTAEFWKKDNENASAVFARQKLRGREVFSDMLQSSPAGSLLNNATGGYLEIFGGKGLKNLDDKLAEGNPDIFKKAKGHGLDGLEKAVEKGVDYAYMAPGMAGNAFNRFNGLSRGSSGDAEEAFKETENYQQEMTKAEGIIKSKVLKQYKGIKSNNKNEYTDETYKDEEIATSVSNSTKDRLLKSMSYDKLESEKKKYGANTNSYNNLNDIQKDVEDYSAGRLDNYGQIIEKIEKLQLNANDVIVDKKGKQTFGNKYKDYSEDDRAIDKVGYTAEHFAELAAKGKLNEAIETLQKYDEQQAKANKGGNTNTPSGNQPNGSQPSGNQPNNFNNANVTMKDSKTEITGNAEIKDTKTIADKLDNTISGVLKKMEETKKAKENDKVQKIVEMLEKMNKTLDAVKKNTKK